MAVAVGADDRIGADKTSITTSLPIMARATLPRIVRAGDRFEASVIVEAHEAGEATPCSFEAQGATLLSPAHRTVHSSRVPREVRFEVRADDLGTAHFTARASLGKHTDSMTLSREVVTPLVPEVGSIDGETTGRPPSSSATCRPSGPTTVGS